MKVLICIPYTGYIPPQAAYSLPAMMCYARAKGIEIDLLPIGLSLVYEARERASNVFLEGDYGYLLFIDSDMVVPVDLLVRLVSHDKDIVSALAFKRFKPYEPCIFKKCDRNHAEFWLDYPKGLIEIEGVGMACTLIKKEVFEKTPKPWFFPEPIIGEDLSFCVRARENGLKIFCDTELICGHCGLEVITDAHYLKWKELSK
jgi:cellulose synthase/poly-beta-1,6-N-acetylglucosamine synthase-like glycosyltransferase